MGPTSAGNAAVMSNLLRGNGHLVAALDKDGRTALLRSCIGGHLEVARILVEAGAGVSRDVQKAGGPHRPRRKYQHVFCILYFVQPRITQVFPQKISTYPCVMCPPLYDGRGMRLGMKTCSAFTGEVNTTHFAITPVPARRAVVSGARRLANQSLAYASSRLLKKPLT